jgi:hypothetical protein
MSILNSNFKKLSALSCIGITALILTACGGGGGGVGPNPPPPPPPPPPPGPTTCFQDPTPSTQLQSQNVAVDSVFHNYTNPDSSFQIYGYANPNPIFVKKIKVFNNYSKTIYPVVYSPTPFTGSDGKTKTLSRIFVGKPACNDLTNPKAYYAGIPSGGNATVYVPKQMWDAGHVKIFTEPPQFLQEDVKTPIVAPIYTVDTNKDSPNRGYMIYTSGTPNDFPQELAFQLTEYTIQATCKTDTPNCAAPANDQLTVDFDISAVDQLFIPVAIQESTGSRGFVGTGMKVEDFQVQIHNFINGTGVFSFANSVGWPFYYGSNQANGYDNNLVKIPMGYNVINSILFPSPSPFNIGVNSIFVRNKATNQFVGDQATLLNVQNNLLARWTNFSAPGTTICNGQADQAFCTKFIKTINFLYNNIVAACQYSALNPIPGGTGFDPALCTTPSHPLPPLPQNPRSVLTDIDKIRALVGYTFSGTTFDNPLAPTGPNLPKDPDNMCTNEFAPAPPKDGAFYSNCFRDMAKSVLRGVPYPFWLYPNQFYPDLSSIYTLNPVVWLAHKQLNLSVYAFSVDDDIGNQQLVGNGINLAVGGLKGLASTNAFDPKFLQVLAFPGGTTNVQWNGTVSGVNAAGATIPFPACIPGQVGACDLNIQDGGFKSVDVSLTGVANPANFLKFTISAGTPKLCSSANPDFNPANPGASADYMFTPIVTSSCSTSAGLQNCTANVPKASFSSKTLNCAQTMEFAVPVPV